MRFVVLASGSKGNATVVQADNFNLLIDCGISYRELSLRLQLCGLKPSDINAVLITHPHSDHIRGLPIFLKNNQIPVYTKQKVYDIGFKADWNKIKSLNQFGLGPFKILAFDLPHDEIGSFGFIIDYFESRLVYATDLGTATSDLSSALNGADAAIVESNHDLSMLKSCIYPEYIKKRISSAYGHLSNCQSRDLLGESLSTTCQHVVLAHLSEVANTPEIAFNFMKEAIPNNLYTASQSTPSGWLSIISREAQVAANF